MPSVSREDLIERLRGAFPRGTLPALALVLLLNVCVANSTVSANWVPGSGVITPVAVLAGLLMAALALVRRIPWPAALLVGLLAAPLVAFQAARGPLLAGHPTDPTSHPMALLGLWLGRIGSGAAFTDEGFILALVVALFWVAGGWLAWSVLRWQQPLLGILPGAAVLATNVLNFPDGQNGYVLAFLLLLCGLLLWTTYRRQLDWALKRTMRLSGEVRWDFWEAGVVVSVVVLVLGIFLPPLSTTDRTVDFQSGIFRSWADLQQRLNHSMPFGAGTGQGGSVGFALDVKLGAQLNRTQTPVFVYQANGDALSPYYFRGINLGRTVNGEWQGSNMTGLGLNHGQQAPWIEQYQALKQGSFQIQMLKPPNIAPSLIVYPGQLVRVDHDAVLDTARGGLAAGRYSLFTIDEVTGRQGTTGSYTVTVQGPTATEDQLRQAGAAYPEWVQQYRNFVGSPTAPPGFWVASGPGVYRSAADMQRVHDLAVQVTAGATNPYDQATAIESYLRGGDFKYTLKPPPPKPGEDPLTSFLFDTHEGYCEYFATAMGDMLRSLGLPVRLVNGFGPGTFDQKLGRTVVREADAHTWPEVYFPTYGWVPFEPTADGVYNPIPRGTGGANCRGGAENCGQPPLPGGGGGGSSNPHHNPGEDPGLNGGGGSVQQQGHIDWMPILGGVVAGLAILLLLASRWLRPRSVSKAWRRTGLLARLAGIPTRMGETPLEFGNRLALALPQAAVPARELAAQFTITAYAPAEMAESATPAAIAAWRTLRPHLLRSISRRLRRR